MTRNSIPFRSLSRTALRSAALVLLSAAAGAVLGAQVSSHQARPQAAQPTPAALLELEAAPAPAAQLAVADDGTNAPGASESPYAGELPALGE